MNLSAVDAIAKAVLYEGYMLYPYRPSSVKNQQRWNFGVLCPQSYSEAQQGSEACIMQTECLVEGDAGTTLDIRVRFLQLVARSIGELIQPVPELPSEGPPEFQLTPRIEVAGRIYQSWQEAVEREVIVPTWGLEALALTPVTHRFHLPAAKQYEALRESGGPVTAIILRQQTELQGAVEIASERLSDGRFRIRVVVRNLTPFAGAEQANREEALLASLASTHTVLGVENGKFCSMIAPTDEFSEAATACRQVGTWPVLVGEEGAQDTLLSSPIILYDYPQIAPESAGDLFDGTEIDEILSLRIMTLTDEEKREMSQSDDRARLMLERTETLPMEQLMKLHGVLRNVRPSIEASSSATKGDVL
jgi:hypothetical protein